jgi:hypothetical protein
MPLPTSILRTLGLSVWLLALLATTLSAAPPSTTEPTPGNTNSVYLPLIIGGSGSNEPEPVPEANGGLFLNLASWSYNATVALDAAGGLHAAYFATGETSDGIAPAYYAYCPSDCVRPERWRHVALAERASDVQIAVNSAGQPRVLISPEPDGRGAPIRYAACDSRCSEPASWKLASVASTALISIGSNYTTAQSFALDPAGRPHFVYADDRTGINHYGSFLARCVEDCTNAENWDEIQLDREIIDNPVLHFDSAGTPHLLGRLSGANGGNLFYAAYAGENGWAGLTLGPVGSGGNSTWTLQLDGEDRLRVAFYQRSWRAAAASAYSTWLATKIAPTRPTGAPAASGCPAVRDASWPWPSIT